MKGRGQNISSAAMAQRVEAPDSLDFFPTPPWATRALCEHLNHWGDISTETCLEPACGEGHMARPLAEYFAAVAASDIHDYGFGQVADFLGHDGLFSDATPQTDWIVTNPPFNKAAEFARRAFELAGTGVALLVRTSFVESVDRCRNLFAPHPPEWICQFSERVPMVKGRLDRRASSATAYCWIVWLRPFEHSRLHSHPAFVWLPPGTRARLERDSDYQPVTTD